MKSNPGIGWVRADALPSQSATEELLRLRRQIEELQEKLAAASAISPKATEHLAQGEDALLIAYSFVASKSKPPFSRAGYTGDFDATWNEIFGQISPLLIDEASDQRLMAVLSSFVEAQRTPVLLQSEGFEKSDALSRFEISDQTYETIKVQLLALGLIQKSSQKKARSVSDRHAYWTLTPAGEALMMSLRAIRRPAETVVPAT
jgi:hypothetical protein